MYLLFGLTSKSLCRSALRRSLQRPTFSGGRTRPGHATHDPMQLIRIWSAALLNNRQQPATMQELPTSRKNVRLTLRRPMTQGPNQLRQLVQGNVHLNPRRGHGTPTRSFRTYFIFTQVSWRGAIGFEARRLATMRCVCMQVPHSRKLLRPFTHRCGVCLTKASI